MRGEALTLDQQRVLDEIAQLARLGFDAPPGHLAHTLDISRERVDLAIARLRELGLELSTQGRAPR